VIEAAEAVLRPGISGFGGSHDPAWDLAGFRAACHAAMRAVRGGRVLACDGPGPGRNHYRALVERVGSPARLRILLNAIHPLLAFAREDEAVRYAFLDAPELAAGFFGACEPVRAAVLAGPLDLQAVGPRLAAVERAQAAYWRPGRVGDLVFNHWD
jgi:hypothetical protein